MHVIKIVCLTIYMNTNVWGLFCIRYVIVGHPSMYWPRKALLNHEDWTVRSYLASSIGDLDPNYLLTYTTYREKTIVFRGFTKSPIENVFGYKPMGCLGSLGTPDEDWNLMDFDTCLQTQCLIQILLVCVIPPLGKGPMNSSSFKPGPIFFFCQ